MLPLPATAGARRGKQPPLPPPPPLPYLQSSVERAQPKKRRAQSDSPRNARRQADGGSAAGGSGGPGGQQQQRRLGSLAASRPTDPEHEEMLNALCRENVSIFVDPTRAVCFNEHTLFDPYTPAHHPPPISTLGRGGASAAALVRGAIPASAANEHEGAIGDAALAEAGYTEVLEAFYRVDGGAGNTGVASFPPKFPSRLGKYRVRYFLQGSAVSLGTPLTLHVREVVCELEVPADVVCGEGLECAFKLHYSLSDSEAAEKEIRIISESLAAGTTVQQRPRQSLARILHSTARAQALARAFLRRVLTIRLSPPDAAALMVLELTGSAKPIRRDDDKSAAGGASGEAAASMRPRHGSQSGAASSPPHTSGVPEPGTSSRVWAGLFMLESVTSRWRRLATMLGVLMSMRSTGVALKSAVNAKLGIATPAAAGAAAEGGAGAPRVAADVGERGSPEGPSAPALLKTSAATEAARQRMVQLRPPRPAPYDPKVPIESYWLPGTPRGVVRFGSPVTGAGQPLYPGIYQVSGGGERIAANTRSNPPRRSSRCASTRSTRAPSRRSTASSSRGARTRMARTRRAAARPSASATSSRAAASPPPTASTRVRACPRPLCRPRTGTPCAASCGCTSLRAARGRPRSATRCTRSSCRSCAACSTSAACP